MMIFRPQGILPVRRRQRELAARAPAVTGQAVTPPA
jgi:hypothetical protein